MIPVSLSAIHTDILPLSFLISPFRLIVAHYSPFRSPLTLFKDPLSRFPVHIVLPLVSLLHPNTPSCSWSHFSQFLQLFQTMYYIWKLDLGAPRDRKHVNIFLSGSGLPHLIFSGSIPLPAKLLISFLYIWVVLQCVCVLPFQCPFIGQRTSMSFPVLLRIASQWVNTCLWGGISICQGVFIAASV